MSDTDVSAPDANGTDGEAADPRHTAAVATLTEVLGEAVLAHHSERGELWVRVHHEAWQQAGYALRDDLGCRWFDFLSAIDWLPSPFGRDMDAEQDWPTTGPPARDTTLEHGVTGGDTRLQIIARVQAVEDNPGGQNLSVTLKADLPNENPATETWIPVYAGANWHEREAWEMFGIAFVGHPDLRHIYLPGEFEGHPLRKDFPLLARRVKPWPGLVDVEDMPAAAEEAPS
ncbi:MAG: NADH-quinone oxidoreductase subunit C [bacterium]|nr:NADH-quinone oxidoreductase subunit C [bacterium]